MRYLVGSIGVILIAVALWEAFETIILPRRAWCAAAAAKCHGCQ